MIIFFAADFRHADAAFAACHALFFAYFCRHMMLYFRLFSFFAIMMLPLFRHAAARACLLLFVAAVADGHRAAAMSLHAMLMPYG